MEPHMWWEGGFRWMWIFPLTFMVLIMVFIAICAFGFFRRSGGVGALLPHVREAARGEDGSGHAAPNSRSALCERGDYQGTV